MARTIANPAGVPGAVINRNTARSSTGQGLGKDVRRECLRPPSLSLQLSPDEVASTSDVFTALADPSSKADKQEAA